MSSFNILPSPAIAGTGARLGRLVVSKGHAFDTPTFVAQASRGVVPHLSHDNLRNHTQIKGVYTALEDFVEKNPGKQPIYTTPATLREFISLPKSQFSILAPRRTPPIICPAANTDDSISILTSVGYRFLTWQDYTRAIKKLKPELVVSMSDIPDQKPGKNRVPKMVMRTELWLRELLERNREWAEEEGESGPRGRTPIFAPILPLTLEEQRLYLEFLEERIHQVSGLAIYDYRQLHHALDPENGTLENTGLADLPRLSLDAAKTPLDVLQQIEAGVDVLSVSFVQEATDAGIALDFYWPRVDVGMPAGTIVEGRERKVLGIDMWSFEYSADLQPLSFGLGGGSVGVDGERKSCDCYACRKHHRAYIQHLLQAKEMTAWVLLQIHNYHILQKFFLAIQAAIARGSYEEDKKVFLDTYLAELPEKTGQGPRVRGYQFKTEGGAKKKNPPAFKPKGFVETNDVEGDNGGVKLGGDEKEKMEEAEDVGEGKGDDIGLDVDGLEERGMGKRVDE